MKHLTTQDLQVIASMLGRADIKAADAQNFLDLFARLNAEYQEALNGDDTESSEQGPEGTEAVRATD